jgi:N-acetylmuramoyl-L-alanine amidase
MKRSNTPPNISTVPSKRKLRYGWQAAAGLLLALLTGCAGPRVKDTSRTFRTVVIDAGHGGKDSGAVSRRGGMEKSATLAVAKILEPKLAAAGFHTVMTRRTDQFIPLNRRVAISNRQTNAIFVSVHFNSARRRAAHGSEVHFKSAVSRDLARVILKNVAAVPGFSSRGIQRANFRVLRLNEYPAVLVECGFLSNSAEAARCFSPTVREKLASAIAEGIIEQRGGPLTSEGAFAPRRD